MRVVVVLGHRAAEIAPVLAAYPVRWVINADYQTGMLSSMQCGVRAVDRTADYLICLGDQPRLSGAVVEQVLQARKQIGAGIIIPTANGKRGHPVLIRNTYRAEILGLPLDVGLNAVTRGPSRGYVRVACGRGRHSDRHGHASRLPARAGPLARVNYGRHSH